MDAHELEKCIAYAISAHRDYAKSMSKTTRKWDIRTPYSIHPIWCAMTLLQETSLPSHIRENGYKALLYHDILEDTNAPLPSDTPKEVVQLVKDMTFESFESEMQEIWNKSDEVKLLKLYDKVSNLLDGTWMSPEKKKLYIEYTRRLTEEVEKIFGDLNIVRIARTIIT